MCIDVRNWLVYNNMCVDTQVLRLKGKENISDSTEWNK